MHSWNDAQNWIFPSCQNLVYRFTCNNSNYRWKDVLLNNRWVKSIFSVVYTPPFSSWPIASHNKQLWAPERWIVQLVFIPYVMYTLLIVEIRCMHSLVVVMGVNETSTCALSSLTPIRRTHVGANFQSPRLLCSSDTETTDTGQTTAYTHALQLSSYAWKHKLFCFFKFPSKLIEWRHCRAAVFRH